MKDAIAADRLKGKTLVAVASGANMNFDRLRYIAERAELGEKREAVLAVTIPETPGSFKTFCGLLGARNISEFNYRYSDPKIALGFGGLSVPGAVDSALVVDLLQRHGLVPLD